MNHSEPQPIAIGCHRFQRGFTLVELLVTVAIVAILAAVAYPSYQEQVAKARRAEMQGELVRLAQFMERLYSETGCYNPGADNNCALGTAAAPTIGTGNSHYTVAFTDGQPTATTFRIRATPIATGPQKSDGIMEIDNQGQRFWDKNDNGNVTDAGENSWTR